MSSSVIVLEIDAVSPGLNFMMHYPQISPITQIDRSGPQRHRTRSSATFSSILNQRNLRMSLPCQKLQRCRIELSSLLDVWHVSALIEYKQSRVRRFSLEPFAIRQRQQTILTPPDNQRRLLNVFDPSVEKIFAANNRCDHANDGVSVARGNS